MADTHDQSAHAQNSPDVEEHMSIGRYIATRFPTLVPPMNPAPNPFKALTLLNRQQWMFFAVRTPSGALLLISYSKMHQYTNQHHAGRLLRLDLGCIRLLHRLPDDLPAGQDL